MNTTNQTPSAKNKNLKTYAEATKAKAQKLKRKYEVETPEYCREYFELKDEKAKAKQKNQKKPQESKRAVVDMLVQGLSPKRTLPKEIALRVDKAASILEDAVSRGRSQSRSRERDSKANRNYRGLQPQSGLEGLGAYLLGNPSVNMTHDVSEDVKELLAGLKEVLENSASSAKDTVEQIKSVVMEGQSITEKISNFALDFSLIVGFMCVTYTLVNKINSSRFEYTSVQEGPWNAMSVAKLLGIGGLLVMVFEQSVSLASDSKRKTVMSILSEHAREAWNCVVGYFNDTTRTSEQEEAEDELFPQSLSLVEEMIDDKLLVLILSGVSLLTTGTKPGWKTVQDFVGNCGKWQKGAKATSDVLQYIVKLATMAINWVREHVLGLGPMKVLVDRADEVNKWADSVLEVYQKRLRGELELTMENADRVLSLKMHGMWLMTKWWPKDVEAKLRHAFNVYMGMIEKLLAPFEQANLGGGGPRIPPLVVCISGSPGIGKSFGVYPLLTKLLARVLPDELLGHLEAGDFNELVYNRQHEQVYWDGYRGQFCCAIDDFAQARDVAGTPDNEYMNLIRISNIFPMMCHMAHMTQKGKTIFRSRIVYMTTNHHEWQPNSIVSSDALRRRARVWKMEINPKYAVDPHVRPDKMRICPKKVREAHPDEVISMQPYLFRELDESNTEVTVRVNGKNLSTLNSEQLIDRWEELYRNLEETDDTFVKGVNQMAKDEVLRRRERDARAYRNESLRPETGALTPSEFTEAEEFSEFDTETDAHLRPPLSDDDPCSSLNEIGRNFTSGEGDALRLWLRNRQNDDPVNTEEVDDDEAEPLVKWLATQNLGNDMMKHMLGVEDPIKYLFDLIMGTQPGYLMINSTTREFDSTSCRVWKTNPRVSRFVQIILVKYFAGSLNAALQTLTEVKINLKHSDCMVMMHDLFWTHGRAKLLNRLLCEQAGQRDFYLNREGEKKGLFRSLFDLASERIRRISDENPMLRYAAITLTGLGAAFGLYKLMSCFGNSEVGLVQRWRESGKKPEYGAEGKAHGRGRKPRLALKPGLRPENGEEDELTDEFREMSLERMDINAEKVAESVGKKNQYNMFLVYKDGSHAVLGDALFLYDRTIVFPYHYLLAMRTKLRKGYQLDYIELQNGVVVDDEGKVRYRRIVIPYSYLLAKEFSDELKAQDIALLDLTAEMCQKHSGVWKHLITKHQLDLLQESPGFMYNLNATTVEIQRFELTKRESMNVSEPGQYSYQIKLGWGYKNKTTNGDCGTPIYASNKAINSGKLVGMHSAGNGMYCGGTCLWKELFMPPTYSHTVEPQPASLETDELLDMQPQSGLNLRPVFRDEQNRDMHEYHTIVPSEDLPCKAPRFSPYGRVKHIVPAASISAIRRSPLWGKYRLPRTAPAALRPKVIDGEIVDPYTKNLVKYGKDMPPIDAESFRLVARAVGVEMRKQEIHKEVPRMLTLREAIEGISTLRYKPISRRTSPGYPYVLLTKRSGKMDIFGDDEHAEYSSPLAQSLIRTVLEQLEVLKSEDEDCPVWIFTDNLKDERRPKEKVRDLKTRIFSGSPLDNFVLGRMLFGKFMLNFEANALLNGSAIGVNPYSQQWDFAAQRLLSKGNNILAGDFSGYDASQDPEIFLVILEEIIEPFYKNASDGERRARRKFIRAGGHSLHIRGDTVYQWHGNMPSGWILTATLNTLYNKVVTAKCYVDLHPGLFAEAIQDFFLHVVVIMLGDDAVISVHSDSLSFFNQYTLVGAYEKYGLSWGVESKDGKDVGEARPLTEVTFLKRTWRRDREFHGRWVAPLDLDVVLEVPMWTKKGLQYWDIVEGNVQLALEELSLHGRETFDYWQPRILAACEENDVALPVVSDYDSLFELVCSRESYY